MNIYLHIGLTKTASTYLQENLFIQVSTNSFVCNPPEIIHPLEYLLYKVESVEEELKHIEIIKCAIEKIDKDLLISHEDLSFDDYQRKFDLLRRIFKSAKIILFLRFQPNWLLSSYKQTLSEGNICSLKEALSLNLGMEYEKSISWRPLPTIELVKLVSLYQENYGKENLKIFFFENFVTDRENVLKQLCEIINIEYRPEFNVDRVSNRGYSAFTCCLLVFWQKLQNFFKRNYQVKRGGQKFNTLLKRYWDRFIYIDWDLLKRNDFRGILEEKFKKENEQLKQLLSEVNMPAIYFVSKGQLEDE